MSASPSWTQPRSAMSLNFGALLDQLAEKHRLSDLDAAGFDQFMHAPGEAVVLLVDDPDRAAESWDLAVIFSDLLAAAGGGLRTGLLRPGASAQIQPQFGISRLPALLFLRDGGYVGTIEGLRAWSEFVGLCREMRQRPVGRAPSIGIAVSGTQGCHQEGI